jgi:hypothetical protein
VDDDVGVVLDDEDILGCLVGAHEGATPTEAIAT